MKAIAIDIETEGLVWSSRVLTVAASWRNEHGEISVKSWCVNAADLFHDTVPIPAIRHDLVRLIASKDVVIMHNATFDLSFLIGAQVLVSDDIRGKLLDTLLTARMTGPRESASLASLATSYGVADVAWLGKKKLRSNMSRVPVDTMLEYNEEDAKITLLLGEKLWEEGIKIYSEDFLLRESDFCRLMAEIRCRGKALDRDKITVLRERAAAEKQGIYQDVLFPRRIEGANDRDGLLRFLTERQITGLNKTDKGNWSLDEDSLTAALAYARDPEANTVIAAVLRARHLDKSLSTWIDGMLEHADGELRVHPNFTVAGAVSYRLTCSQPNLQAVPKEMDIWVPQLSADYSQAELRIASMYAQENELAKAFASGEDVHMTTARTMFGKTDKDTRTLAKRTNFASIYGSGDKGLAENTGLSIEKARELRLLHQRIYPALNQMSRKAEQAWKSKGYLTLISGKRLYATKEDIDFRAYKAFNQLIQGSVAEIIKEAMLTLDSMGIMINNQIHDSLEFDPSVDVSEVKRVMQGVVPDNIQSRTNPRIVMQVDTEIVGEKVTA